MFILTVLTFIIGIFFRLYQLDAIPFGLNNDAAWDGLAALDILRGHVTRYFPYAASWHGEGLLRMVMAELMVFLGPQGLSIKLASAIFSILTLWTFFLLAKKLFNQKVALFSLLFLATSGWQIIMARSGWRAVTLPFFSTLTFYFLWRYQAKYKVRDLFLLSINSGFLLYTYDSVKHLPLFVLCWLIFFLMRDKNVIRPIRSIIQSISIFLVVFILVSFPMLWYVKNHPVDYFGRAQFVSVYAQVQKENSLSPLLKNLQSTIGIYTQRANGNDFFVNRPLLDKTAMIFFFLGLLWGLLNFRKKEFIFIVLWWGAGLLPGILSEPNGNRAIDTLGPVYLLCGLGAMFLLDITEKLIKIRRKDYLFTIFFLVMGLVFIFFTFQDYFGPQKKVIPGFYPDMVIVTSYLKTISPETKTYFIDNYPWELLNFYLYRGGDPFVRHYEHYFYDKEQILKVQKTDKALVFVMKEIPQNLVLEKFLLEKFPTVQKVLIKSQYNHPEDYLNVNTSTAIFLVK